MRVLAFTNSNHFAFCLLLFVYWAAVRAVSLVRPVPLFFFQLLCFVVSMEQIKIKRWKYAA